MWAKPYKADPKYHYWSIMVGLDEANVALYKQTGLKGKLKDEGDSHAWAKFTRPESKVIKGELRDFDPPTVTYNGEPFKKLIGNGSIVKCVVQVYDYEYLKKKGVGQRCFLYCCSAYPSCVTSPMIEWTRLLNNVVAGVAFGLGGGVTIVIFQAFFQ
jgi:hypothetical protein